MAASFARSENTQNSLRKIPYVPLFSARVGNAHVYGPSFPVGRSNNFSLPTPIRCTQIPRRANTGCSACQNVLHPRAINVLSG